MRVIMRLVAAASLVTVLAALAFIFGPNLSEMAAHADGNGGNGGGSGSCQIHYYAKDPGKEVSGAFGPAATPGDQASVIAQLHERRECGSDGKYDPALVAAQYADWSNATLPSGAPANMTATKVNWADATTFANLLATNQAVYQQTIEELNRLEAASAYSTAPVSAGIPSLYMMDDGRGGVTIKQGQVAHDGTNIVFTAPNGAVVRYRLECGFQPNWTTPVKNVPVCTGTECAPPPVCPPGQMGTPPNNCYVPCPYDTSKPNIPSMCQPPHVPTCEELNGGLECKGRSVDNPGIVPMGPGQQTDGGESRRQQESGQTSGNVIDHPVGGGTTSGSTTSDPGSSGGQTGSSGATAPGATPGGDDQSTGGPTSAPQDPTGSNDTGGTNGQTCVPTPAVSC